MKPLPIVLTAIALLGLAGGFLFTKNQSLQNQFENLGKEKTKVDTELAVLKASDLAKEVELLSFTLKATQKNLSESESEASRLDSRVKTLETSLSKIGPYLSAIDAVQKVENGETGITKVSMANADPKVTVLQDPEISDHWRKAKDNIHFDGDRVSSYNQKFFGDAISAMVSRIFNLLP